MNVSQLDINGQTLMRVLLDWNRNVWRRHCEVIEDWMPNFTSPRTRPKTVVKCGNRYLRHSQGPHQGFFWDMIPDDMISIELAILALSQAPHPGENAVAAARANCSGFRSNSAPNEEKR